MVGMINKFVSSHAVTLPAVEHLKSAGNVGVAETAAAVEQPITSSSVSTLARQLSDAARRAESRDSTLGYKALGEKARSLLNEITGTHYHQRREQHHTELPDTEDQQLLARSRQATEYLKGEASNPFRGLSRDQLALITYDEGNDFTVNERRAAWGEACRQEQIWRQGVVQRASAEYAATGEYTSFFEEVFSHYESLPAIERAQYPKSYADGLLQKMSSGADDISDDVNEMIFDIYPSLNASHGINLLYLKNSV